MGNRILDVYGWVRRDRWEEIWRSPDVPRMLPSPLVDQYLLLNEFGRTIKPDVDLSALPTRTEWSAQFPEPEPTEVCAVAIVDTPPVIQPIAVACAGYTPVRVRVTPVPPITAGAWSSVDEYRDWAADQYKLRGAILALSQPFLVRAECDGTVLQALANIEPVLLDDQVTRIDLSSWWDRIEMFAPAHGILAYREFIDAINDERPTGSA